MRINFNELTPHEHFRLRSYSTEASDLGWSAGQEWPLELTVPGLGNGQPFVARERIDNHGEFGGVIYRQSMGCLSITVFND